jgi:CheY-specific phosphatase CheX
MRKEKRTLEHKPAEAVPDLFPALLHAAERYLTDLGLAGLRRTDYDSQERQELQLEDVTAFIQVTGGIQGGLLFSVDHGLSRTLAKYYMIEEINEIEAGQYAVEVVAEVANVVSAHSLNEREEQDLFLGNPLMILSRDMAIRTRFYQSQTYETSCGKCRFIYIPMMDKTELASIVTVRA